MDLFRHKSFHLLVLIILLVDRYVIKYTFTTCVSTLNTFDSLVIINCRNAAVHPSRRLLHQDMLYIAEKLVFKGFGQLSYLYMIVFLCRLLCSNRWWRLSLLGWRKIAPSTFNLHSPFLVLLFLWYQLSIVRLVDCWERCHSSYLRGIINSTKGALWIITTATTAL